ncbi:hypothetical protein HPP92_025135 [Vanilla planifolia]|uniref:Uncharacterized protein n=1 Tax=Vanilla planifolia TaxID=51239 RepID=A0A835PHA9_VANPL|nr:hypothetical protein HPP92_025135 [Vanilla planifolia]
MDGMLMPSQYLLLLLSIATANIDATMHSVVPVNPVNGILECSVTADVTVPSTGTKWVYSDDRESIFIVHVGECIEEIADSKELLHSGACPYSPLAVGGEIERETSVNKMVDMTSAV